MNTETVCIRFEQAIYGSFNFWDKGYATLAHSPGVRKQWLSDFAHTCQSLGQPPSELSPAVHQLIFAMKLPSGPWLVARGSAQGCDDRGRPGAWAFHGIFITGRDYRKIGASPFVFDQWWIKDFHQSLSLQSMEVECPVESGAELGNKRLFDPSKLAWVRRGRFFRIQSDSIEIDLVRQFWQALPIPFRCRRSLTTWAFRPEVDFQLAVVGLSRHGNHENNNLSSKRIWFVKPNELSINSTSSKGPLPVFFKRIHHRILLSFVICLLIVVVLMKSWPRYSAMNSESVNLHEASTNDSPPISTGTVGISESPELKRAIRENLTNWAERLDLSPEKSISIMKLGSIVAISLRFNGPVLHLDTPEDDVNMDSYVLASRYAQVAEDHAEFHDWPEEGSRIDSEAIQALALLAWCCRSRDLQKSAFNLQTSQDVRAWFDQLHLHLLPKDFPKDLPVTGLESTYPELVDIRLHLSRLYRLK